MMDTRMETEELRDSARRVLEKTVVRHAPYDETPTDGGAALRATMAELGWMLLTTPEEKGGLGQSFVALSAIYEELGRAFAEVPFVGSMAAVDGLLAATDDEKSDTLLAAIGSGEAVVAVAFAASGTLANGSTASGDLTSVLDGGLATHLLVVGDEPGGEAAVIDLNGPGVSRSDAPAWDLTRKFADIRLDQAPARRLVSRDETRTVAAVTRAHFDLAVAQDSLGGGDQALTETIAYMATREQFNRPIGSFQALKHRAADLKVGLEMARAFTARACDIYAGGKPGWASTAAQAKLMATAAWRSIGEEAVQFHGGIGFTWEHDCHIFLKRSMLSEMLGGTPEQYRDRVAPDILRRAFAGTKATAA